MIELILGISVVVAILLSKINNGEKINEKLLYKTPIRYEYVLEYVSIYLIYEKHKIVFDMDKYLRHGLYGYYIEDDKDRLVYTQTNSISEKVKKRFDILLKDYMTDKVEYLTQTIVDEQGYITNVYYNRIDGKLYIRCDETQDDVILSSDAILDKILKHGLDSLSKEEKEYMDELSKKS
jgi:hypothetical protein